VTAEDGLLSTFKFSELIWLALNQSRDLSYNSNTSMKRVIPMKRNLSTILSIIFLFSVLVLVILRLFFMENYVVRAGSMKKALNHGDYILSWKLVALKGKNKHRLFHVFLKREDIVVLQVPGERESLIKRIIGLPGESIELQGSSIFINGKKYKESYVPQDVHYTHHIYHIPEGKLFVLGDMRLTSRDSREFGFLGIDDIKGKVFCVYFPFNRIRWFL
jgi:signal peptidase I